MRLTLCEAESYASEIRHRSLSKRIPCRFLRMILSRDGRPTPSARRGQALHALRSTFLCDCNRHTVPFILAGLFRFGLLHSSTIMLCSVGFDALLLRCTILLAVLTRHVRRHGCLQFKSINCVKSFGGKQLQCRDSLQSKNKQTYLLSSRDSPRYVINYAKQIRNCTTR